MSSARKIKTIADLTPDPRNANKGTERGAVQLENSLREYGAGRSILVDRNGVVIAGNKTLEQAASIGLPIKAVHTDGSELVVVVRDDLDSADPRAQELAIADNRVAQTDLDWDVDVLLAMADDGIELDKFWRDDELSRLLSEDREIEMTGDDRAGASPWERMDGSGSDGVMFSFGAISAKCSDETYKLFIEKAPDADVAEWVEAVILKGIR